MVWHNSVLANLNVLTRDIGLDGLLRITSSLGDSSGAGTSLFLRLEAGQSDTAAVVERGCGGELWHLPSHEHAGVDNLGDVTERLRGVLVEDRVVVGSWADKAVVHHLDNWLDLLGEVAGVVDVGSGPYRMLVYVL